VSLEDPVDPGRRPWQSEHDPTSQAMA